MKNLITILLLALSAISFGQTYDLDPKDTVYYTTLSGTIDVGKVYVQSETYSTEALALFSRMYVKPTSERKALINNTIVRLKNNKLFTTKFDVIKCYAGHDSASCLLNWIENDHNSIPHGKTLKFFPNIGFKGNAADTSYLDTDFYPASDAVRWHNTHATLAAYVNSNVYEDHTFILGYSDGGVTESASGVIWRYGSLQGKVNEGTNGQSGVNTTGRNSGFHLYTRTDTNTVVSYFNKFLQNSVTRVADQVLLNNNFTEFVNEYDKNRRSDQTVSWTFIGDSLNAKEVDSLYAIVTDYMEAVGHADSWGNDTMMVQDFEGTGWDNHAYKYTTGTTYPDYTTYPIHGAQSDSIPYGTNVRVNIPYYSDTVNVFFSFRLSDATPASNSNIFQLRTSTTNVLYLQCLTSGTLKLGVGTPTQNATGTISSNTNYHCWIQYINGSGADAKGYVYYSTTKTKPASPNITITNGSSTAKPDNVYMAGVNAGGTVVDQIIIKRKDLNVIP